MPPTTDETMRDLAFDQQRQIRMTYWPERWKNAPDWHFEWSDLLFPPAEITQVPSEPGVYIFALKPMVFDFLSVGVLYVGKAQA